MTVNRENVLERIDAAIKRWRDLRSHWQYRTLQALGADPFMSLRIELVGNLITAIEELCPRGSSYTDEAHAALEEHGLGSLEAGDALVRILEALWDDLQTGQGRT